MRRSKTNGRVPPRHTNVLQKSTLDNVQLGLAVEERFLEVCKLYLKERGVELITPYDLDSDMLLWRTMRVRHKKGDFRNTKDEERSVRKIAQWTLDVKLRLCDQPAKVLEWPD